MKLAYVAFDKAGRQVANTIDAGTIAEATDELRRRGLFVSRIGRDAPESGAASKGSSRASKAGGGSLKNVVAFTRQLHVMLSTGSTVVDALHAVERQTRDPKWKETVKQLRSRIEQGTPLSEALTQMKGVFDPVYCSLIAAGESAGKLPEVLDRLAVLVRKQLHVRSTVIGAMIYPSLLITVAISVLVLMLTFVLPRFAGMFTSLDVPLPASTKMLMAVSDFLIGYWWAVVPGVIVSGGALVWWQLTPHGRTIRNTVMLRVPVLGGMVRSFASARIARLLGMLLDSYLPMQEVLGHVKASMTNAHYKQLICEAEDRLTKGQPVSDAFNNERLISIAVYEAIRSGEETGQMATLTLTIAEFMDEENDVVVKSLTSIMEPVILIIMGAVVGFVAVSMFLPLFDLSAAASQS